MKTKKEIKAMKKGLSDYIEIVGNSLKTIKNLHEELWNIDLPEILQGGEIDSLEALNNASECLSKLISLIEEGESVIEWVLDNE